MIRIVFLGLFLFVLTPVLKAQPKQFFAQAQFNSDDKELIKSLELSIRQQPGIWMVRIDAFNGNVLIYTTETPFFTEDELLELFGEYASKVTCPYIGVVRQDLIKPFPFKDCQ